MKLCAACCQEYPREHFSKKQWISKPHRRRCKRCVDANRDAPLPAALPDGDDSDGDVGGALSADYEDGPSCWICLEAEGEEGPLRRDCSCRGDSAGFAHLTCLVMYAGQKCAEDLPQNKQFNRPWKTCPNCYQGYQNELAIDLATEYISFVENKYQFSNQGWMHLEAHHLKLEQLMVRADDPTPKAIKECKKSAKKCFHIIDQLRLRLVRGKSPARTQLNRREGGVHGMLGTLYLRVETEESLRKAIEHLEKWRSSSEQLGDQSEMADAEQKIAFAESLYRKDTDSNEAFEVNRTRRLYELKVERNGQESPAAIRLGTSYAVSLHTAMHRIEAERLAIKMVTISRRAHGTNHEVTKSVEKVLTDFKQRIVVHMDNMDFFLAIRYEDGDDKCVIRGPIKSPRMVGKETTTTVDNICFLPIPGTPVICHGLSSATNLNGKIGETREIDVDSGRFPVYFEDKRLGTKLVKPDNLRILFELPDCQC